MGGKAKKRREKNFLAAHGGNNRLPPPPKTSSIDALPSKLRRIMAFTSPSSPTLQGSSLDSGIVAATNNRKNKKEGSTQIKPQSESEVNFKSNETRDKKASKSTVSQGVSSSDANDDMKKKKRKRKPADDLRFEAELEKLGGVSKRKQRKKEFLKAKKKKVTNGKSELNLDHPKHDEVKFGDVAQEPPKLAVVPAFKKAMHASRERLRLQAIEAYRSRKGWTNRPGLLIPSLSTSSDML